MNSKRQSRCTTKPSKTAATRAVLPFSRNNRKGKAELERETWYGSTSRTATASKPSLAKSFLGFCRNTFFSHHKLRKICNKNSVKLSYSCMPNVATIISSHNKALLRKEATQPDPLPCNCRHKSNCSLDGRCREKSLVYKATVHVSNSNAMTYYGLCETEFKSCYYNHLQSFKHRHKASATELSKYIWRCKDAGLNPSVSWEIDRHAPAYNSGSCVCQLCLEEKYQMLISNCAQHSQQTL